MAKIGRPKNIKNDVVVSIRFDCEKYDKVKEVASLESVYTGKQISAVELIRQAVDFVFGDNERLRESFKRAREHIAKKY